MAQNKILLIILALLVSATLFAQTQMELKNGLTVKVIDNIESKLVSVMLVCPLPDDFSQEEMADLSLINRLIWRGGSALGRTIEEHEFSMFALRFGGSLGSQVLSDALVVNYTMPAELLEEVLSFLTVQWGEVSPSAEQIERLATGLIRQEQNMITSSVKRQVIRQLERRLWSGLRYANSTFGSEEALKGTSLERVQATFMKIKNPAVWKLYIKGAVAGEELTAMLENSLGTIPGKKTSEATVKVPAASLGVKLELPARLTSKHAVVAYRLPLSKDLDQVALALLAETWGRSPQFAALREDLKKEDNSADLSIGLDIRKAAGSLYLYASWNSEISQDDILDRMKFIAEGVRGTETSGQAFESARKALKINYYTSRSSSRKDANWVAVQGILSEKNVDYINRLNEITPEILEKKASEIIKQENSLTLVTVAK